MINTTRPSDTHAPPREVSRSEKGLRARETAIPSTPPGPARHGIANSIELHLNLLDDDDPMSQARDDGSVADRAQLDLRNAGTQERRRVSTTRTLIWFLVGFEHSGSLDFRTDLGGEPVTFSSGLLTCLVHRKFGRVQLVLDDERAVLDPPEPLSGAEAGQQSLFSSGESEGLRSRSELIALLPVDHPCLGVGEQTSECAHRRAWSLRCRGR